MSKINWRKLIAFVASVAASMAALRYLLGPVIRRGDRARRAKLTVRRRTSRDLETASSNIASIESGLRIPREGPQGTLSPNDFNVVGMFDLDWLFDARVQRMLDNFAASPGGFKAVRVMKALNSGSRELRGPSTSSGIVWPQAAQPMDFSVTFDALDQLISRDLVPFVTLGFFPRAVSPDPALPPPNFNDWKLLVSAFFAQLIARFSAVAVSDWWFEVWNEPNLDSYWRNGDTDAGFAQYLELYRATSDVVVQDQLMVRLGGPTIAWLTPDGPNRYMIDFLGFLRDNPNVKCDFLTFHRKGSWDRNNGVPDLSRLISAAEETATLIKDPGFSPPQFTGVQLPILNDEADMRVGFDTPFLDRMNERYPAWLTALLIAYDALTSQFQQDGFRFMAASDNANLQLVQRSFDGRRSIMTVGSSSLPADLFKVPVYGFYEFLRLVGGEHGIWVEGADSVFPNTEAFWAATFGSDHITSFYSVYPRTDTEIPRSFDFNLSILGIPWPTVNVAWFQIDELFSNSFATAGGALDPASGTIDKQQKEIRRTQELTLLKSPIERGVAIVGGTYSTALTVRPYTSKLLWITPEIRDAPTAPAWIEVAVEDDGSHHHVVLRWSPNPEAFFYSYRLFESAVHRPTPLEGVPTPLRAAMWVDTNPPRGTLRTYGVLAQTASGVESAIVWSNAVAIP